MKCKRRKKKNLNMAKKNMKWKRGEMVKWKRAKR